MPPVAGPGFRRVRRLPPVAGAARRCGRRETVERWVPSIINGAREVGAAAVFLAAEALPGVEARPPPYRLREFQTKARDTSLRARSLARRYTSRRLASPQRPHPAPPGSRRGASRPPKVRSPDLPSVGPGGGGPISICPGGAEVVAATSPARCRVRQCNGQGDRLRTAQVLTALCSAPRPHGFRGGASGCLPELTNAGPQDSPRM